MPDADGDSQIVYTVQENNDRYEVCTASGRIVLVFTDAGSAAHYATLLNEALRAGYKLGYRDGRNS